jgi:Protein of unknown function (DUF2927)
MTPNGFRWIASSLTLLAMTGRNLLFIASPSHSSPRWSPALATTLLLACSLAALAQPQHPEIDKRRAAERKTFTDAQIFDGFFKVAFGAELGLSGPSDRIRKYDQPVRVFIENRATPDRSGAVAQVIADIGARIANLDIAVTERREDANYMVRLVRERDFARTIRELYGNRSRQILRSLEPQCLSGLRRDPSYRILRSDVILVADVGDFTFYDCAYEELLQGLGPIRDDPTVPWTMFNDNVQMGFFDVYDQYLLNILYDPRLRAGMTRAQVRALLPEVMPPVRAFVARVNGLQ